MPATPLSLDVRAARIPADSDLGRLPLLSFLAGDDEPVVWLGGRRRFVGSGRAATIAVSGPGSIDRAGREWDRLRSSARVEAGSPLALPIGFASFAFCDDSESVLLVPEFLVVEGDRGRWAVVCSPGSAGDPLEAARDAARRSRGDRPVAPTGLRTGTGRMTQEEWTASVGAVAARLRVGEALKAVMTRDMVVRADSPIDPRLLVERLSALYPATWRFVVAGLVGATPEMLASCEGDRLRSRVLAGTISPGEGPRLMASSKDRREHALAVASVAEALGPLAADLSVPDEPFVLDLPNVTHLATDVEARLDGSGVFDALAALHPTAAVCGTPREAALALLREFERTERGRYSGPVGWVDAAGDAEFALALRCGMLEEGGRALRVFAGGGIMPDSDPAAELAETRAKMSPLLEALGL
ncbi:chorismate-binding protein [Actinomyces sp. B33]|uniref:isochorismate synthase n=1 Tax=Actinomyces sp. B33 TaxID=2942131 RepID=UPI0023421DD5|nr:chorismate-binding protein [Actinomyces sp. B33]MDC4233540.1 chorismate-binding protein [Actinomyces sp. B33]